MPNDLPRQERTDFPASTSRKFPQPDLDLRLEHGNCDCLGDGFTNSDRNLYNSKILSNSNILKFRTDR